MKKNTYVEPVTHVFYMSAVDYFLASGNGNAPTVKEDNEAGFLDY